MSKNAHFFFVHIHIRYDQQNWVINLSYLFLFLFASPEAQNLSTCSTDRSGKFFIFPKISLTISRGNSLVINSEGNFSSIGEIFYFKGRFCTSAFLIRSVIELQVGELNFCFSIIMYSDVKKQRKENQRFIKLV